MEMKRYVKSYVRDFSIMMEEAWYYALSEGFWKKLGIAAHRGWPNIFYIKQGIIEVWDNPTYIHQIKQAIFERDEEIEFFDLVLGEYEVLVKKINNIEISDEDYFTTLFDAISIFSIFWYGIQEERLNSKTRKKFVEVRDKDTIYDTCDKITRFRITRKLPHLGRELTTLLKKEFFGKIPSKEELNRRLESFILIPGEVKEIIKIEDFAKNHGILLEFFNKPEDGIVRGVTAYGGKVIGRARIIRRKDEIGRMNQGEILISPMTTPDVFLAIYKAAAIVTDEGGMLCHAAIISRELKIPCIIGTKVASDFFKDGDLVEVDADNSTIKTLKENIKF